MKSQQRIEYNEFSWYIFQSEFYYPYTDDSLGMIHVKNMFAYSPTYPLLVCMNIDRNKIEKT